MWQATVRRAPVALTVAKFGAVPGIVCSLDDAGVLSACYQGTDPPTSAVVAAERKDIDYDQINQEHRKLLQVGAAVCWTSPGGVFRADAERGLGGSFFGDHAVSNPVRQHLLFTPGRSATPFDLLRPWISTYRVLRR